MRVPSSILVVALLASCVHVNDREMKERMEDKDLDGFRSVQAGGDDCDDEDPSVHPLAQDLCGDEIDGDCDGDPDGCRLTGPHSLPLSSDASFMGLQSGDHAGYSVSFVGDIDRNGLDDIAVGAPMADFGQGAGGAALFLSPLRGSFSLSDADAILTGISRGDHAGTALSGAGDPNGDGAPDLLIGASQAQGSKTGAGAVYLLGGNLRGRVSLSSAWLVLSLDSSETGLGEVQQGLGDQNADGVDDILVAAPGHRTTGPEDSGAVWLLHGPLSSSTQLSDAYARFYGEHGERAGRAAVGAGDVNGDGLGELWISGYPDCGSASDLNAGGAWLVDATSSGESALELASFMVCADSSNDEFGHALAGLGDINDDGYADLAASAPLSNGGASHEGSVHLWLGPVTPGVTSPEMADIHWAGDTADRQLGASLERAGDIDGDGHPDLLIGATSTDASSPTAGRLQLVFGPLEYGGSELLELLGEGSADQVGWSASANADANADGRDDLLVGAYGHEGAGAAFLVLGGWF